MNNKISDEFEIRPITSDDKDFLQIGLSFLSPESIRQRFFSSKKDFSEKELKNLTEVDQVNHIALIVIHVKSQIPAGTIRCVRDQNRPDFAEFAVTIIDSFQRKGLGLMLLETLSKKARTLGITHFYGDFHNSNTKVHRLLEKYCANHQLDPQNLKITHKKDGFLYFEMTLA